MSLLRGMQARCPYCAEVQRFEIDLSEGLPQEFVSDCAVCCRPIEVTVTSGLHEGANPVLRLRSEDEVG